MFELAFPYALLLLPLPLLLWKWLPPARLQQSESLWVPFYDTLALKLETHRKFTTPHRSWRQFLLIWILLVIASSAPRYVGEPIPLTQDSHNIMMALDLSGSMELTDMLWRGRPVSRLAIVKNAAQAFIKARAGDAIGLILFGSRAYLQTPITPDKQAVLMRVEDATVGLAGNTTSIGDALGLAVKRLQDVPPKGRIIILLTDGANNSGMLEPLKAAQLAKSDGIKVYTIGLGADANGERINDPFFNVNASADLDEETLQKIAEMTGGRYFRATDGQSLHEIYDTINRLETVKGASETLRPQIEYYPWPLGLGFLMLLYWLLRQQQWVSALFSRHHAVIESTPK